MSNEPLTEAVDAKIFVEFSTEDLKFVDGTKKTRI